ncbi:putative spermatogenesis-associated protein 31C2, partial [Moschus berezovskii]|uniref:putative spermatogenesis-associated protein 31C2 n=1 Tax=Moschus berezovskii TaxID=68408 RepID=UPI0024452F26
HRSSPHSPWRPAISGLDHSNSPGSALAWWQEEVKAWSVSTLTQSPRKKAFPSTHQRPHSGDIPETGTSTVRQCPPPSEVSMEIQDHHQPSTPTMPQFQRPPQTHMETQVQSQLLAQTMPHIQAPVQDHMETQVPPLLWTPSMSQCQPPQPQAHMETQVQSQLLAQTTPLIQAPVQDHMETQVPPLLQTPSMSQCQPPQPQAHMEIQVQHLSWTPTMPQFQSPVRAHVETQAQPLPWGGRGQATMPQCPPPSKISMEVQDHQQPSTPTMPEFQPPPWAHMEIQAQPIPLNLNIPHCQPSSRAHMEIQAQPQSLTRTIPRYHPRPQAQLETTVHPSPSRLVQSSSSQHQIGSVETSCPTVQNKPSSCSSNAVEQLEYHFWKKQLERERTLPSLVKNSQQVFSQVTPNLPQETRSSQAHSSVSILPGCLISPEVREKLEHHISNRFMQQQTGLPYRIQASQKLMQPQDQYPRPCQAQGRQWRSRSSAGLGKRRQDAQKMRSKCPAQIQPGRDLRCDIGQSVGKIVKDLYMVSANPPVKDPRATPESESMLSPDKKHPKVSRVLTERKAEQICETILAREKNQQSLRSQFQQLILKKREVPSESHFKERIKLLLQWIFPNKCQEPGEPLQKGKPEIATVQSQESIKSKSIIDSGAVEAQTLMTTVGQILKEKMVFHYGPHAM